MSVTSGGLAVAMLVIAGLAGSLNRKFTMTVSLTGSAGLAFVAAFSPDFMTLLICRTVQGILIAGFPALAMAYINEEFEPEITGFVTGVYISGTSIGGLASRLLSSTLTDFFSWQTALAAIGGLYLFIGIWFFLAIPLSRNFRPHKPLPHNLAGELLTNLRSPLVCQLYVIAFLLMGSFTAVYNYIAYPLMAPPYRLSQTAVGGIFLLYLLGTFSSTFMGSMADHYGRARILCLSIAIMLGGVLVTLTANLLVKVIGLAIFTFGFFGSHSTAGGWVGRSCPGDKAQASSLYLLFYYFGASMIGTAGGVLLSRYGWSGVVLPVGGILGVALLISGRLLLAETHQHIPEWERA